ncbi:MULTISPECIES: DUF4430 domain-containing protein [Bacillus cereus group]|uniref:DUF4430 domain-containing protein n=1 Tax=Bacillus cereus group TaxID=86661 RepID=UPI000864165C|nr:MULTISPECIES: DUF4430 domain-containing protein [Bacillus cereus group]AWC28988.1 cell wall anchor protein [Bacillus cytotoxicus]AWC39626.1 cell wall anchor protein [Bacillus cytotoxicus]AWC47557.1 cell wall anchor protein [Bacillus cytotoxicus]AWC53059.1 cell wall anchor protein [Bacillus cytotoxicus]AWC57188.1 cell wall anchor protein [Bacillus cytotoxicus]
MAIFKKWLLTSIMSVALVFVSFANTVHITFAEGKTATLAIIGESQRGIILCPKEVSIEDGETAYSLLQKVMGDKVVAENSQYGMFVKGIDGLMGGATSGWTYDVNDKAAMVGADSYKLTSGDVVAYRFVVDWNNMNQETLQQTVDKIGTCKTGQNQQDEQKQDSRENKGVEGTSQENTGTEVNDEANKPKEPELEQNTKAEEHQYVDNNEVRKKVEEAISKTAERMLQDGIGTDWMAVGLSRSGQAVPMEDKINYVQSVTKKVEKRLHRFSATDIARTVIGLTAMNADPTNVAGQNLIPLLYQSDTLNSVTGYTFALIALDTKKYEVPVGAKWSRVALVQEILHAQHTDGGWTYNVESSKEDASSIDVTGMVLAALAPYQNQQEVKEAIAKAEQYLSSKQLENGGFEADGQENANSVAQAVLGLSAIGSNPTESKFTKKNGNAVQNLLSYQLENGEFKWLPSDAEGNTMATEQALLALIQYKAFLDQNGSIYDWSNDRMEAEIPNQPIVESEVEAPVVEQEMREQMQQPKDEPLHVAVQEEVDHHNEKTTQTRQLPKTGAATGEAAIPVGMGVICIASAYALWRRKAA